MQHEGNQRIAGKRRRVNSKNQRIKKQNIRQINEKKIMLKKMNEKEMRNANGGSYCKVCGYSNWNEWKVMRHICIPSPCSCSENDVEPCYKPGERNCEVDSWIIGSWRTGNTIKFPT